jgi:hypothetical protein
MIAEALSRKRSRAGRIGGHMRWALNPDLIPDTSPATQAQRDGFQLGHGGHPDAYAHLPKDEQPKGLCRACPKRVAIPASADDATRERTAARLRSVHYSRLADLAVAKRRRTG